MFGNTRSAFIERHGCYEQLPRKFLALRFARPAEKRRTQQIGWDITYLRGCMYVIARSECRNGHSD